MRAGHLLCITRTPDRKLWEKHGIDGRYKRVSAQRTNSQKKKLSLDRLSRIRKLGITLPTKAIYSSTPAPGTHQEDER